MLQDDFIETRTRDDLFKLSSPTPPPEDNMNDNKDNKDNKQPDFSNILNNPDLLEALRKKTIPKSPKINYDNEDEITRRVLKLINKSCDINYDNEHEKVQEAAMEAFIIKYQNLKINYSDSDIGKNIDFPKNKNLNFIHKHYHGIIKSIYVSMNLGQTKLCYVLILMVLEFICVKALGLPMAGFTKLELNRMYKYESMMIELGESWYSSGGEGEPQPIEWRIATSFIWNVVIFLGIKIVSNYMENENMVEIIRGIVDKLFENNVNKEDIETGEAKKMQSEGEELMKGLDGGGFTELMNMVTNIGGGLTRGMENQRKKGPVKKNRFIFSE